MKTRSIVMLVAAGAAAIVAAGLWRRLLPVSGPENGVPDPVAAAAPAPASSIERQLGQFLAEQSGLEVVSLSSIDCGATTCEIALTGSDVNPRYVGAYSDLYHKLSVAGWNDFLIRSAALGTREIAPGAREYVITFDYQPYVDLSADPLIASRQYAACAAFWRRQTEFPTPDDIARAYLETAERYVALAGSVLGEQEATRVAAETRGGPLIRGCYLL